MILIGSGALLVRAFEALRVKKIYVDCVVCSDSDSACKRLAKLGARVIQTQDQNHALATQLKSATDEYVLSINNKTILLDELLNEPYTFLNIHNGLTQKYRGIAEVCVFAAICHGVEEYGATLHRILPGQLVDTGPILFQNSFRIPQFATFERLFRKSLANVQTLLDESLRWLAEPGNICEVISESQTLRYSSVKRLLEESSQDRVRLACELGVYKGLLPRLANEISRATPLGQE